MERKKYYVDCGVDWVRSIIYIYPSEATRQKQGDKFLYLIGPFCTKRGARCMIDNPMATTVSEAGMLLKKEK
jgi:hypothetical protein